MPAELIIETERSHRIAAGLTNETAEIFLLGANTERFGGPEVVVWLNSTEARQLAEHLLGLAERLDTGSEDG